jgi:hypothetical protein
MVKTHTVTGLKYLCKKVTGTRFDLIEQMKKLNNNNPYINILTNGDIGYFLRKDRIVTTVKGWTKI